MTIIGKHAWTCRAGMAALVLMLGMVPTAGSALAAGAQVPSRHSLATAVLPGTTWRQQAELTVPSSPTSGEFGYAVAISGSTALVGAPTTNGAGAAYVFVRSGSTWTQQAEIIPVTATAHSEFGWSVALAGDTAVIGQPYQGGNRGAAYVYVRSGSTWSLQATLAAAHPADGNYFGWSVGISGDTIIVGTNNPIANGTADVFVRSGTHWIRQAELSAGDGTTGDGFGASLALNGNTALIGGTGGGAKVGAAYVFVRSGTGSIATWSQEAELINPSGISADAFSASLAVAGNTAVVGAPGKNTSAGDAYMYMRSGTAWSQQAELPPPSGAKDFGISMALNGNTLVVGANGSNTAYVYVHSGSTWTQQAKLTSSGTSMFSEFGWRVGLSGNSAIVGAYGDNHGAQGAAYVFVRA